ncbi:phosphodiester glycosidase family protein [Rhizobiales bacterium]|uniref:phosphodiester glycosidase family protein n=1 Tax=Hongsoonwoonella zoysiae TaxID=2821844 RepID=UPI00156071A0|nr:phosphodiester glycosidase family protein [Hongsoonwoonella zoysiae]NRG17122.1 phosphodiester glycosidase family protein [Hongsoonwoonella zoysiae]
MRRIFLIGLTVCVAVSGLIVGAFYLYAGTYGINAVLLRGGTTWVGVEEDDLRISSSMRTALANDALEAKPGELKWQEVDRGLEVAELPVMVDQIEVDRFLLARIDPEHFQFEVLTSPAGNLDLDGWVERTDAVLLVNGSYYDRYGRPDTPLVSNGALLGPTEYSATHGAFVVEDGKVAIHDLHEKDWHSVLKNADHGMVSYPLLVAKDRPQQVKSNPRWLANRSFVAKDNQGMIVIGTTKDAYFSLQRLSSFLKAAPLNLSIALNLDGGPVACQAINRLGYTRDFCGAWETATEDDEIQLLQPVFGNRRWALPIVLAVFAKE